MMRTVLSLADTKALQANNWRAKKLLDTLQLQSDQRALLEDLLHTNYEILDQEIPTHLDLDPIPDPIAPASQPAQVWDGEGKRVALFIGHNKGTGAQTYKGEDEWETRNRVGKRAAEILREQAYAVGLYYRNRKLGYTSAMKEHGKTAGDFGAHVSLELHFNNYDGRAHGGEILVYSGRTASTLGCAFTRSTKKFYPGRKLRGNEGVVIRTAGRGVGFNKNQPCPSGVYEPAFADNPNDWDDYRGAENEEREAQYIADIINEFFASS